MKIAVCIKISPDPEQYNKIKLNKKTKAIVRSGIDSVISSADLHAIELAIQLKEQHGGTVTLISMGPPSGSKQLRMGLSYGADEAVLISDPKFGGADALATSYTLSKGIEKAGPFDIIITGNSSDDGATAHIPSQLGEWLELPHMTDIISVECKNTDAIIVKKQMDTSVGVFEIDLPAVIGVAKAINEVRIPNVADIFAVKTKQFTTLTSSDLDNLDERYLGLSGSPTQAVGYIETDFKRSCVEIKGTPAEAAAEIKKIIASFKQ